MLPLCCVLVLVLVAGATGSAATSGDAQCACRTTPIDPTLFPSANLSSVNMTTYGVGCGAWDELSAACEAQAPPKECEGVFPVHRRCLSATPDWCSREWCYVADPDQCALARSHSTYFQDSGLYFSYATCGELDTFSPTMEREPLRGAMLQVGIQNNSGGWQGSYNFEFGTHARQGEWTGPLWHFFNATAEWEGFYYNITDAPAIVKEKSGSGSSFWHCTHGTATGHLDLCVGLHTVTPERFRQTDWFIVQLNVLTLVVPEKDGFAWEKVSGALKVVFAPMSPGLWVVVLFVLMPLVTVFISYQERSERLKPIDWMVAESIRPYHKVRNTARLFTRNLKRARHDAMQQPKAGTPADDAGGNYPTFVEHFLDNYFTAWRALSDGALGYSRSVGARVTQLGLGIFMVLCITAYTASFTTFLVNRERYGTITSLEDAMNQRMSICGTEMGSTSARAAYPYDGWVTDPRCPDHAPQADDLLKRLGWSYEQKYCLTDTEGRRVPGIKTQADPLTLLNAGYCE